MGPGLPTPTALPQTLAPALFEPDLILSLTGSGSAEVQSPSSTGGWTGEDKPMWAHTSGPPSGGSHEPRTSGMLCGGLGAMSGGSLAVSSPIQAASCYQNRVKDKSYTPFPYRGGQAGVTAGATSVKTLSQSRLLYKDALLPSPGPAAVCLAPRPQTHDGRPAQLLILVAYATPQRGALWHVVKVVLRQQAL